MRFLRKLKLAWQKFQMWDLENDAAVRGDFRVALYWAKRRASLDK